MSEGVVFVVYGQRAKDEFSHAKRSLDESGNTYPIQTIIGDFGAVNKPASRRSKTSLFDLSGFDNFVYLDADTRPREGVKTIFDILADGWDLVITPSSNQSGDTFWHIGEKERDATYLEIGLYPVQLQCGVFGIAKNERTKRLFEAWYAEWLRYSGEDQAAFIRALYACPVKVWLMGYPWNGGAAIGHNWGALR